MAQVTCTHIEVYPFRRAGPSVEFLALRRSAGQRLPGIWQPVTGRIDGGETAVQAAAREVLEETGLEPARWWALETMTTFFNWSDDTIQHLPLFAAEVDAAATVQLSGEHDAHRFVNAEEAAKLFLWNAQRRGLAAVQREVLESAALARALEIPVSSMRAAQ